MRIEKIFNYNVVVVKNENGKKKGGEELAKKSFDWYKKVIA